MVEMGLDGGRDEGQDVAALLATGFDHREHRLYKAAAAGALGAEGEFPPDHRMTQCLFARIVGRLDVVLVQKSPQPVAMADKFPTHSLKPAVAALRSAQQQAFHAAADRSHPTDQGRAGDRAVAVVGPMGEPSFCRRTQVVSPRFLFDLLFCGAGLAWGCCVLGGNEEFCGVFRPRSSSSTRASSFAIRASNISTKARTAGVISASSSGGITSGRG